MVSLPTPLAVTFGFRGPPFSGPLRVCLLALLFTARRILSTAREGSRARAQFSFPVCPSHLAIRLLGVLSSHGALESTALST